MAEPGSERKAQNLLRRFPVTDLAQAVALTGDRRTSFLRRFVTGGTNLSYQPTRDMAPIIYGARLPLDDPRLEPWERIEGLLRKHTKPHILDMNIKASRCLFDLIRPLEYDATACDVQVLRVTPTQVVKIDLPFYITQGERLIFQFPHPRSNGLSDHELVVLGSVIHHAYVQGDFSEAHIEVSDLGRAPQARSHEPRFPRVRPVSADSILDRKALTGQIEEVYALLRMLSGGGV